MKTISKSKKSTSPVNEAKYQRLWDEMKRVSHEALASATPPTPMVVGSPSTPLGNDVDPNQKMWYVADGVCGFAWVVLDSGRTGFSQWIMKKGYGSKHYQWGGGYKGVSIWLHSREGFAETRQSLQLKQQVCGKVAAYLRSEGVSAHYESRID
jgi:hypothetical protein